MANVTDREKLDMACRMTVEFHFGSICDTIDNLIVDDPLLARRLKSKVRNHGNEAIRVLSNHMDYYHINRNHRKDTINSGRVIAKAQEDNV